MTGGVQIFEAIAAISIGFGAADFFLLLVSRDEAIAQASCIRNRGNLSKNYHIGRMMGVSRKAST